MNLIEKLGGYERANKIANCKSGVVHPTKPLLDALLEYRREHNIFEVGDKVVIESYRNTYISCGRPSQYSIGDLMVIHNLDGNVISDDDYNFIDYRDVRHATDAEIKAGHRIIHPTDNLSHLTDHCTDIRNHISPNTIVLDSDVINFDLYIPMRSK